MKAQRKIGEPDIERYRKNYLNEQDGIALYRARPAEQRHADAFDRARRLGNHLCGWPVVGRFGFMMLSNRVIQGRVLTRLLNSRKGIVTGHRSFFTYEAPEQLGETTVSLAKSV